MEICPKSKCIGCEACVNVCQLNAITMEENSKGFLYPKIDFDTCAKCNKCIDRCPANDPIDNGKCSVIKAYAVWNRDSKVRFNSSSGGVFSALAESVINAKGVVFGAKWDADFSVVIDHTVEHDGIVKFRGSKYQQAKIGNSYKNAKSFLIEGKIVLFSGTPCLIHGLIKYLGKPYSNLITVDLICHGVPSPKIFQDYKTYMEDVYGSNIEEINLRYKKPAWSHTSTRIIFKSGERYQKSNFEDPFFVGFNEDIFLRECCSNCAYTNLNRVSDITLSDFWGYTPKKLNMISFEKGCSAVLINSKAGLDIFQNIKNGLVFQEKSIQEVMRGNRCLYESFPRGESYNKFWKDYEHGVSFEMLANKYFKGKKVKKKSVLQKLKERYRGFVPEVFVSAIKKIKK